MQSPGTKGKQTGGGRQREGRYAGLRESREGGGEGMVGRGLEDLGSRRLG